MTFGNMAESNDTAKGARQDSATLLKSHIFSEHQPHLVCLLSGITSGLGSAIAIEWKAHFEAVRHVPIWETISIAIFSTSSALWITFFILSLIQMNRRRDR